MRLSVASVTVVSRGIQLPLQIETQIVRLKQSRVGARQRSGRSFPGCIRMYTRRRSTRSMRFSIATAWSSAEWGTGTEPRERHSPFPASPTTCGAPITGRVHARRSALLLSAHHHRLRQPISVRRLNWSLADEREDESIEAPKRPRMLMNDRHDKSCSCDLAPNVVRLRSYMEPTEAKLGSAQPRPSLPRLWGREGMGASYWPELRYYQ